MITLVCETSTLLGSFCIAQDSKILAYSEMMRQGSHSEALNLQIEDLFKQTNLNLSDVDLFVSGVGPGSFTGIRISLNTIKTYAYIFKKPVLGVDSLENLARLNEKFLKTDDIIVPMINAYKNMIYLAAFQKLNGQMKCIRPAQVIRVQSWNEFISENCYVVGDGYLQYKDYLGPLSKVVLQRPLTAYDYPKADMSALIALDNLDKRQAWNELLPLYIRESEAEENAKGMRYEPLK